LLALLKTKGSVSPIFNFFLRDFLKAFPVLYFYRELATKLSSKDINLLNLKSSLYTSGTLPPNKNKLYSILTFKPLTFSKNNSRGTKVTSFSTGFFSILIVKASTKSL
jgi:hypothetical protein